MFEFVGWGGGSVCACVRVRTCMSVYALACVRQARTTAFLLANTTLAFYMAECCTLIRHDAVFRHVSASPDSRWVKCVCAERARARVRSRD